MHATLQLLIFWILAFLSLGTALVLLNLFYNLIGDGLELFSLGKEAAIAGVASLIEAASVWVVASFIPLAGRALILPVVIVALIYKVTHFEDWSRYEILLLLTFQIIVGSVGAALFFGHFQTAIVILVCFAAVIAIIAGLAKDFF